MVLRIIDNNLIFTTLDHIVVYNTGDKTHSSFVIADPILPANLTKGQTEVLKKEIRYITSLEVSKCGQYIGVATENKQILVYDRQFNVLKNFILNRVASKVTFTSTNDIIVADRTGDVYLYKLNNQDNQEVLLLGHLSVILDIIVSDCGNYVITCDRDEKIRVSCYPNSYNIAQFCLGHKEFVNVIKLVGNILISASGDGTVRFWEFLKGNQVGIIETNKDVDSALVEKFSKQMDGEKVDVTALPITDLQVVQLETGFNLAVSLYMCEYIHLYSVKLGNYESKLLQKFDTKAISFRFLYLHNSCYVLSDVLKIFHIKDDVKLIDTIDILQKYNMNTVDISDVTTLYKRKYDNVQEYLQRKKQRLESK